MRAKTECKACNGIQDATLDANNNPVYVCRCCNAVTVRKVYTTKGKTARLAVSDKYNDLINELIGG